MNKNLLSKILKLHCKWLNHERNSMQADLSWSDLSGMDMRGVKLKGAIMNFADLRNTNLSKADLREAKMRGAIMKNTDSSFANLMDADLTYVTLSNNGNTLNGADLRYANLDYAQLEEEDIRKLIITEFQASRLTERGRHLIAQRKKDNVK